MPTAAVRTMAGVPEGAQLAPAHLEKTVDFAPSCLGIDTGRLAAETQGALERLRVLGPERLGEFDFSTVPRIRFVDDGAIEPPSAPGAR